MKHNVCVITGSKPLHVGHAQAERMVQSGVAEWAGKRRIKLRVKAQRQGAAPFPEFHEAVGDVSRGVGLPRCTPRLTEDVHEFLHAIRRLSV